MGAEEARKDCRKVVVKLSQGFTLNLLNYESARIEAGVEIEGYEDELPELWVKATKETEAVIQAQVVDLKEGKEVKRTLLGFTTR